MAGGGAASKEMELTSFVTKVVSAYSLFPASSKFALWNAAECLEVVCCRCISARLKDSATGASGNSTQKAFIFIPYRNEAKASLNPAMLSCIAPRCSKFVCRSDMLSASSENAGDKKSSGAADGSARVCESASCDNEPRDIRRSGVVGRFFSVEVELPCAEDMIIVSSGQLFV